MKASEFVAQIQALIAEHGDKEVMHYSYATLSIHPAQVAEARISGIDGAGRLALLVEHFMVVDAR